MQRPTSWHGAGNSKERGLGGSSRKEQSREELLAQAKAARSARSAAKVQQKAALTIQAAWRSYTSRRATRADLLSQWRQAFAAAVAQPDVLLPWPQLFHTAVPMVLLALLPPCTSSTAAMLQGKGVSLANASNAELGPLRGTLALVIRGIGSSERSSNFCTPAVEGDKQARRAWVQQGYRLCQLCACAASVHSSTGASDPVLDAAAARVVALLTDASQWKAALAGEPGAADAANGVLHKLVQRPRPLFSSTARLLAAAILAQAATAHTPQAVTASAAASATPSTGTLQRLMGLSLSLVEAAIALPQSASGNTAVDSSSNGGSSVGTAPVHADVSSTCQVDFTTMLLAAPGFTANMSIAIKARLLAPGTLSALLHTVSDLAQTRRLAGLPALWCAANLGLLLTNAAPNSSDAYSLPKSPHLSDPLTALAFCGTMTRLLAASRQQQRAGTQQQLAAAVQQLWPLGSQSHLLQLLGVLTHPALGASGILAFAGYCIHLVQDLPDLAAASEAGTRGSNMPAKLPAASGAGTSHSSVAAVSATPSQTCSTAGSSRYTASSGSSALNALAFAPRVLPALWRWLAIHLGLPLEAPLEASLDVVALRGGYRALQPELARVLGLFCRVYAQLLLVLDDTDFHTSAQPFSTSQARAIATSLNSLVFHSCFPAAMSASQGSSQSNGGSSMGGTVTTAGLDVDTVEAGQALLAEFAPVALRSLYERDTRRSFCRPALWVAPYKLLNERQPQAQQQHQQEQQHGGLEAFFSAAAIVQSLLFGPGAGTASDATSLQARAGDGQRPASMASLLRIAPQCVPFDARVEIFRTMIEEDKTRGRWACTRAEGGVPPIKVTIRRDRLMEDAFAQLSGCTEGLKARLQVTFINAAGLQEAGLDFGGLAKELLEAVVARGFAGDFGLFQVSEGSGLAYPRPSADMMDQGLQLLEFLGLMVGKALYQGILLGDLALASFFVLRLQGRRPQLDDLAALDPTLHRSLVQVKTYDGDVSDLGLYFTVDEEFFGATTTEELLPGGSSVQVTNSNRLLYVHLLANHHLNGRGFAHAAGAFARGLSHLVPLSALRLFSPPEFNELISGGRGGGIDIDDMMRHAKYSGGYSESSSTVRMFWRCVRDMTPSDRGALLRFVTSTSRAPLGGFRYLQPPLTIHKVACGGAALALLGGPDVDRLPSSSTCFNMLKLPDYRRQATMRKKLLYTIHAGAGFELS